MDEVAKLRAELTQLNVQCQLARDHEVRYALQRGRLEAERTQLLVKMIDALGAQQPLPEVAPPKIVTVGIAPAPKTRQTRKPPGLPTVTSMIEIVLRDAKSGLRPKQVSAFIRQKWWPDVPSSHINSALWHLARDGHLQKHGSHYRLPRANGHAG
jgi:hypothetical protein